MIENIVYHKDIIAIIIRSDYSKNGIHFFTPENFSQQLAYMSRPCGYKISPHLHNEVRREVFRTQEVLFIRSGKVKINLYSNQKKLISFKVLEQGDVILLASGGHELEFLEESQIIEVKQGPYTGDQDKTRFDPMG